MSDVFSKAKRSAVMALIRGTGNKDTELRMVALLRQYRLSGWRRHQSLFGKPDFVFRRDRVAVFVDGCFWHSCPKPGHAPLPKTRAEWWAAKLARNRRRDRRVNSALQKSGWTLVRIWECDIEKKANWPRIARKIEAALRRSEANADSTAESEKTGR